MTLIANFDDDPAVAEILRACGWTPDRAVDTAAWSDWFADEGYEINSDVLTILRSFGSLTVTPPQLPEARFFSGPIVFDPVWAATGDRDRTAVREQQLDRRLWPLGEWSDVYLVLYADTGEVFADGANLGVLHLGKTFSDALRLLLLAAEKPRQVVD
jgi:hypothetical protein